MARLPFALAAVLVLVLVPALASAQYFEDDEEEGPHPVVAWAQDMGNRASVGFNGILTAPADPFMFAAGGDETFEELPGAAVTGRFVGFLAGVSQMPYRIGMGAFDIALAWMPALYMQSPEPRWMLLPWAEHDG